MIRSSAAISAESTNVRIETIIWSSANSNMLVASAASCFTNLMSKATIASIRPMKNGASSQRLKNTQCSRVDSTLFMSPPAERAKARASATILQRAAASLFDGEDFERPGRSLRFRGVDVEDSVAAELLRAIERFVGGLDQACETALRVGLRRRGADADGQHARAVGIRVRNVERHDLASNLLRHRSGIV